MLVLSRKKSQELRIGESITIKVLEVKGNQVRLGVLAPTGLQILRPEAKKKAA